MDSSSGRETIGLKTVIDMSGFERGVAQFNAAVGQLSQTLVKMEAASAQSAGRTSGASAGVTAGLKTAAQSSQNWAAKIGESLSRVSEVALGMLSAQLFQRIGREVVDMTKSAVALDTASIAFERFGGSIDELRAGVAGMMTDADIMRNYNLAAQLVGKEFADELPEILGLLTKAAASTGESMDYMFSSIVRGVGRLSPLILDNLAVAVKLEDAYAAYAQEMGKSADSLTIQEKQTAVLNETLRQLHANLDHIPDVMGTSMQVFSSFGVEIKNIRAEIGEKLLPAFKAVMPEVLASIAPVVEKVKDIIESLITTFTDRFLELSNRGTPVVEAFSHALAGLFPPVLKQTLDWLIGAVAFFVNTEPAVKGTVATIALVTVGLTKLWGAVKALKALMFLGATWALNPVSVALVGIGVAVAGVIALIDRYHKKIKEVQDASSDFMESVAREGQGYEAYSAIIVEEARKIGVTRIGLIDQLRGMSIEDRLIREGMLMTREEFWAAYADARGEDAISAEADVLDEFAERCDDVARAIIESRNKIHQYNDSFRFMAEKSREAAEEMAAALETLSSAYWAEGMTKQLEDVQKAFFDHTKSLESLTEKSARASAESEFDYLYKRAMAYAQFQREHAALLERGKVEDAARLSAKFANEQALAEANYAQEQRMQERNNLIQRIEAKRAWREKLIDMRDQTLREMQEYVKGLEATDAKDKEAKNALLLRLAMHGSEMLQIETQSYINRLEKQLEFGQSTITQEGIIQAALEKIRAGQAEVEEDLKRLRAELEAAEKKLLAGIELPPLDTGEWESSINTAGEKARRDAGESATRVMASVVDDIHKAITAAKDAIVELVDFDVPAGVDLGLGRLADFIIISVESMYATLDPLKSKVESISKSIQPVIDMMSLVDNTTKAIEAATKGASMAMPDMDEWANRFALVVKKMVSTIVWVRDQVSQKGLDDAAAQVEKLAGIVSLVSFDFSAINLGAARFPDMQMWANRFSLAVIYAVNAIIFARDKVTQARLDDAVKQVSKAAELLSIVTTDFSKIELAKKFPDMQAWANRLIISVSMATNAILYLADLVKYDRLEEAAKQAAYVKTLLEIVNTDFSKIELAERFPDMRAWANRLVIAVSHTASAINYVVEALGTDRYGESNLAIAASFADSINALLGTVKSGVDALSAISGYSPAQNLDAKMISFATDMRDVALHLMSAFSAFTRGQGPQLPVSLPDEALEWWKDIAQLVSIVKDGVGALTSLTKYAPVQELPAKMLSFVVDMRDVAYELLRAMSAFTDGQGPQLPDAGLLKPATDWWGAVGDLVGVVKPGIDAIEGLTRYVSASNLEGRVAEFRTDLISIALELNKAVHPDRAGGVGTWPEIHDDALLWWGNVKSIVEVVKPGIDALDSLAKYSAVDDLERRMALFRSDLNQVAIHMNRAVMPDRAGGIGTWPEIREEALEWWGNVKGLIDVIKPGIDALGGLADYVVVENLEQHVAEFRSDLNQVALHMSRAVMPDRRGGVGTWPEIAEEALKWWSDVNSIIGVIKTGVDAIEALSGYTTRQGSVAEKVALLSADLIDVARTMTTMFDVWSRGGPQEIKQEALDFWDSVKSLIGVISPGVKAIADMAEFKQVKDLDTRVAGFADNIKSLVRRLIAMITAEGMPSLDVATAGAEYWSQITTILGAIAPAAAAIQNIGGSWVTEKDLESKFARFKANVVKLVTMMGELTDELESNGSIAKAKNFSQNMQDIKGALDTGLGVLQDVHNRGFANDPHTVKEVLWQFVGDVSGILSHVVTQTGDRLRELRDTFIKRIPQDSDAAYAYGYALGTSVSDGFRAGLGAIPSVIIPPVSGGGAGRNAGTVNNNSTSFSFQYLGQGASDDDMRRFGDYVIQRVTTELGR